MSSIKRHGGKHYLAPSYLPLIPPHRRYLEPYAGGLSVLFAKPYLGISEWVCDTDGDLINWWQVLRDTPEPLLRRLWATPFAEASFREAAATLKDKTYRDKVERATAFFARCRMSRQGIGKGYATPSTRQRRDMGEHAASWWSAIEGLPEVHERLRRVEIWERPALEAIKALDGPDLFALVDPPYLHSTRTTKTEYGDGEMSEEDHIELLDLLATTECKWMLCGYASEMYDEYRRRHNWFRQEFEIANHASGKEEKQVKTEVIWCNYLPTKVSRGGLGLL